MSGCVTTDISSHTSSAAAEYLIYFNKNVLNPRPLAACNCSSTRQENSSRPRKSTLNASDERAETLKWRYGLLLLPQISVVRDGNLLQGLNERTVGSIFDDFLGRSFRRAWSLDHVENSHVRLLSPGRRTRVMGACLKRGVNTWLGLIQTTKLRSALHRGYEPRP